MKLTATKGSAMAQLHVQIFRMIIYTIKEHHIQKQPGIFSSNLKFLYLQGYSSANHTKHV